MKDQERSASSREDGFTYIEVMVALVIFMVGIMGYLSALSASILQSRGQQQQLMARHIAATTMESIMAAKETDPNVLGWAAVGNVGSNPHPVSGVNRGVFVTGFQNVLQNAGPDEVIGTADDSGPAVPGYQRQIQITDICDPDRPSSICATPGPWAVRMRRVVVTIRYFVGSGQREEVLNSVLTDYSVTQ